MKSKKRTLKIEKFEVARFTNTDRIVGGDNGTNGDTQHQSSADCRGQ